MSHLKRIVRNLAFLLLILSGMTSIHAETLSTGRTTTAMKPVDELFESFLAEHEIPGAAVAIAKEGRLLYSRGFGYADREFKVKVQPDSVFRIASISKPITAVAILNLVEQGKLHLDDTVLTVLDLEDDFKKIPNRDERWQKITILNCLQHTGGWNRDASYDPMFRSVEIAKSQKVPPPAMPNAIIRYQLAQPLDFAPGQEYHYSNFGYSLLGRVIEKVTGKEYADFVNEVVLEPLQMKSTSLGKTFLADRQRNEVSYYPTNDAMGPSVFEASLGDRVSYAYGGWCLEAMDSHGGWIASAVDLVSFGDSFFPDSKDSVLEKSSIQAMFAPPAAPVWRNEAGKLEPVYYGCGWMVRQVQGDRKLNTWHGGRLAGTSTILVRRHDGFTWAVLFNIDQVGKDKKESTSSLIDPLMHGAVNRVTKWPRGTELRK